MNKIGVVYIFIGYIFFYTNSFAASYDDSFSKKEKPLLGMQLEQFNSFYNEGVAEEYLALFELLKQKKFKKASNKVNELIRKNKNEWRYYNFRALLYIVENNLELARKDFLKSIAINGHNLVAYEGMSRIAVTNKNYDKAKDYLIKVLMIDDKFIGAYGTLAVLADREGDDKKAEKYLLTGLQKASDFNSELKVVSLLRDFYLMKKQYDKALKVLKSLVIKFPNKEVADVIYAKTLLLRANDVATAEKGFEEMLDLKKQTVIYRLALARLKSRKIDTLKESIRLLDEALAIKPGDKSALIIKVEMYKKLGDFNMALHVINTIAEQNPEAIVADKLAANIYILQQEYQKAFNSYAAAFKKVPDNPTLLSMANLLDELGQVDKAINLLNESKLKGSKNIAVNIKLAMLYEQKNDIGSAEGLYKKVLSVQAENVLALNNIAVLLMKNDLQESLKYAKMAYDLKPNSPAILDTYGYILAKNGDNKFALQLLGKASALAPFDDSIQYHFAETSSLMGMRDIAIERLKKILSKNADFKDKEAAQTLLNSLLGASDGEGQ